MSERGVFAGDRDDDQYAAWRAARSAREVRLYLLACGTFVKVGIAVDVKARRLELQVGNPLRIIEVWKSTAMPRNEIQRIERRTHQKLKQYRSSGEWFEISADDALAAIKGSWSS